MVHAFFGVSWFGVHVVTELIFVPTLTKSTKLAELAPMGRFAPRVSMAGMSLGILTLLSGLAFLYLKFPPEVWLTLGEPQAVVAAFCIALVSLGFGIGVLRPAALALSKDRPATPPPADAVIPEALKPRLKRVAMYMHFQTLLVVLMLMFMVIAIEGGF